MSTVFYKECHGCGKLVRFSSPEARNKWTNPCPFCGEMLVDTAFTTEVELSDPASVAAAKKEEEKHSYQIFSEYLLGDSAKEQKYLDRFKEEQKKAEPRQEPPPKVKVTAEKKKHAVWLWIIIIIDVLGFAAIACKQGAKTAFECIIGVALFLGVAIVICFIKELLDAAPPRHRGGSDADRSKNDWIVWYTVYNELMKNDRCDCCHSSSHDCDCSHSSSHDCGCHHHH